MKIEWVYFFGASGKNWSERFYKAKINGVDVEKHSVLRGKTKYSIGNIDEAKTTYSNERDLINAVLML